MLKMREDGVESLGILGVGSRYGVRRVSLSALLLSLAACGGGGSSGGGGGGGGGSTSDNKVPLFPTGLKDLEVDEGKADVGTFMASDEDGDPLTYSLKEEGDWSQFVIDKSTGRLSFKSDPNYESAGDVNKDNVYEVTVLVSDGMDTAEHTVMVTVKGVNEAPKFESGSSFDVLEGVLGVGMVEASDEDAGDMVVYSLKDDGDGALFSINEDTGEVTFRTAPDYESAGDMGGDNTYNLTVVAKDTKGKETEQSVTVMVTDKNEHTPVFGSLSTFDVEEGVASVGMVEASDDDGTGTLMYSLKPNNGDDGALFLINEDTGEISFRTAPDYESAGDMGGDNTYNLTVVASDGELSGEQAVVVMVTDKNEAPEFEDKDRALRSVKEGETHVGMFVATDADSGDALVYSLKASNNDDAALFSIDMSTGEVSFKTAPDYENPGDMGGDGTYNFTVVVADKAGLESELAVEVVVEDLALSFSLAMRDEVVDEGTSLPVGIFAAKGDPGTVLMYSLEKDNGDDEALFMIDAGTGEVSFSASPDYEMPGDMGEDNTYNFTVVVTGGGEEKKQAVTVTVMDVNDNTPMFEGSSSFEVLEGSTGVGTVMASDGDVGDNLTYSLKASNNDDAGLFMIDAGTGAVTFMTSPDYETPGDMGGDNTYNFTVVVSDGVHMEERVVTVMVTDRNEHAPMFDNQADGLVFMDGMFSKSVLEGDTTSIGTFTAMDSDGTGTLMYSLKPNNGDDGSLFMINENTGEVSFKASPDYEQAMDMGEDNTYDFTVVASDGEFIDEVSVAVTVMDKNESPIFGEGASVSKTLNEGRTLVGLFTASDEDAGDTLTYSFKPNNGDDAGLFTINMDTGEVSFKTEPDHENPGDMGGDNTYNFVVVVSDGSLMAEQTVSVEVVDHVIIFPESVSSSVSINEGVTTVGTFEARDETSATITYSLKTSDSDDSGLFTIDMNTGEVTFRTAPDYENPRGNPKSVSNINLYDFTVVASAGLEMTEHRVLVTVNDVNEHTPVFMSVEDSGGKELKTIPNDGGFSLSGPEGRFFVGRFVATDGDVDDFLTYSLKASNGDDAGLFMIDARTGEVSFVSLPDYEAPMDMGGNNIYDFTVVVADHSGKKDEVSVSYTLDNIGSEFARTTTQTNVQIGNDLWEVSVDENVRGTFVTVLTESDPGEGTKVTYGIRGGIFGGDGDLFNIDSMTGALSFKSGAAPNFELTAKRIYWLTVTATSVGGAVNTLNLKVTLKDVNEAPEITLPKEGENEKTVIDVGEDADVFPVYRLTVSDEDAQDQGLVPTLSGADRQFFELVKAEGGNYKLQFKGNAAPPSFDAMSDADGDSEYEVSVNVVDTGGLSASKNLTVRVLDTEAPPEPTELRLVGSSFGKVVSSREITFDLVARKGDKITTVMIGTTDVTPSETPVITNDDGSYRFTYTVPGTVLKGAGVLDGNPFVIKVGLTDGSNKETLSEIEGVSYEDPLSSLTVQTVSETFKGRFVTLKLSKAVVSVDVSKISYVYTAGFFPSPSMSVVGFFIDERSPSVVYLQLADDPISANVTYQFTADQGAFVSAGGVLSARTSTGGLKVSSEDAGLNDYEVVGVKVSEDGTVSLYFNISFAGVTLDSSKIAFTKKGSSTSIRKTAEFLTTNGDEHILKLTETDGNVNFAQGEKYTISILAGAFTQGENSNTKAFSRDVEVDGSALLLDGSSPVALISGNEIEVSFTKDVSVGIFSRIKVTMGETEINVLDAYGKGKKFKVVVEGSFTNGREYKIEFLSGSLVDKASGDVVQGSLEGKATYSTSSFGEEPFSLSDFVAEGLDKSEDVWGVPSYDESGI